MFYYLVTQKLKRSKKIQISNYENMVVFLWLLVAEADENRKNGRMINAVDVKVIIATHKKYRLPTDEMYLPVHVGAAGKDSIENYQRDDEGENISELNPYFCELTGLYWAWKNLNTDYIGLAHYRRHFSSNPHSKDIWERVLKKSDIDDDLGKIRVFVPSKRRYWIETLYSHYKHTHHIFQLDVTRKIIEKQCPEYLESFDKACKRKWGYMFNMMIMERGLFDAYCSWLFEILFELKKRLGEEGLTPFHSRYYGRISEIIFNVWLNEQIKNGTIKRDEIKELPLVHMEKINWWKKRTAFLKAKFMGKKYSESF